MRSVLPILWLGLWALSGSADAQYANLSQEWELSPLYNSNEGYCALESAIPPSVVGYVVVKDGKIVAEGYNPGRKPTDQNKVWSTTKSWSSMLIGHIVGKGLLDIDLTLGDIFANETDWLGVRQAERKQKIVIRDILTMSAGLVGRGDAIEGQESLLQVLNGMQLVSAQEGRFEYLGGNHILSRIIHQVTGMTPKEYAFASGIFPSLGISESNFTWETFGGVEGSAFGFRSNPRTQAKLGQLYLQKGYAADGFSLIDEDWVATSTSNQLEDGDFTINPQFFGYGYQWWTDLVEQDSFSIVNDFEGAYSAVGAGGQLITVVTRSDIVVAIVSASTFGDVLSPLFFVTALQNIDKLDNSVNGCPSFQLPTTIEETFSTSVYSVFILASNFAEVVVEFFRSLVQL